MSDALNVRVWRGGGEGRFVTYQVPRLDSQTVLDVVTYIQRRLEPSLSYRFSCRVGMCGSCAMTVNGIARWTCRTHVSKVALDGELEIAPLSNLPVIKDLATDMREFFDKWARARGQFRGSKTRHDDFELVEPASPERIAADAG
ncbi:MAG: succinate dehydrogenase/fumarate reductase iron-sulfur subunit, partial [Lautropia sp.]|nr:succinate dehydrogenase/fumarate reductase iron-sulfur subunit [Lautropia sp.]